MGIFAVLFWYLLGGLTFIPLVVVAIGFIWIQRTSHHSATETTKDNLKEPLLDGKPVDEAKVHSLLEQEVDTGVDAHMSAWLTVTREFVDYASLSNKKTKSNTDIPVSLYRQLIGGATKSAAASNGGNSGASETASNDLSRSASHNSPKPTIPKHKYFAVLRHGNLFLYEDSEQLRIRQVIVLANHEVSIYPPNLPENELFLKKNAICISKKGLSPLQLGKPFPPDTYFLFSDVCPEKEDLYFALIRASKQTKVLSRNLSPTDPVTNAVPLLFDENDMMNLIQLLHSSDANLQSRWLNAIIGRLFLSLHKTKMMQDYVRGKIERKLARIKTPNFLDDIKLNQIYCGDSAPIFTNPRLKELTKDGLLEVEVDVSYAGNFRAEVTTKASLQLGSRFKPREVNLLLSVALTNLSGTLLIKMKPPPSDRVWYCFSTMPHMSMLIEPVVSSRQITYSMITRVIENRIRDVVKEVLVSPNMDDVCFFDTLGQTYRGGIWDASLQKAIQQISSAHDSHSHFMDREDAVAPATAAYSPTSVSGNLEGSATLRHRTSIHTTSQHLHKESQESFNGESSPDLPAFLNAAMQNVNDENSQSSSVDKKVISSSDSRKSNHPSIGSHQSPADSLRSSSGPSSASGIPTNGSAVIHKTDEYKALGFGYTPPEFMARSTAKSEKSKGNGSSSSFTSSATSAVKKWGSRYFKKQHDKTSISTPVIPKPKFNDSGKLTNSNKIHTHPLDGTGELEIEASTTTTTVDDGPSIFDDSTTKQPSSVRRFSPYTGGINGDPYAPAADMTVPSTMGHPRPLESNNDSLSTKNNMEPVSSPEKEEQDDKDKDKEEEDNKKVTAEYERLPTDEEYAGSDSQGSDNEQPLGQQDEQPRRRSIVKRRPVSETPMESSDKSLKEEKEPELEPEPEPELKEEEEIPEEERKQEEQLSSTTSSILNLKEAPPLPPRTISTSSLATRPARSDNDGGEATTQDNGKEFKTFPPPIPRMRAVPPPLETGEFTPPRGPPPPLPRRISGGLSQHQQQQQATKSNSNSISVAAAAAAYNSGRQPATVSSGKSSNDTSDNKRDDDDDDDPEKEEENPSTVASLGPPPPIPPRTLGRTASTKINRPAEPTSMVPPPRAVRRKPVVADSRKSLQEPEDEEEEEERHTWMPQEPAPMHIHHPKSPSDRGAPETATDHHHHHNSSSPSSPYINNTQDYEWDHQNEFRLPDEMERLGATMG